MGLAQVFAASVGIKIDLLPLFFYSLFQGFLWLDG